MRDCHKGGGQCSCGSFARAATVLNRYLWVVALRISDERLIGDLSGPHLPLRCLRCRQLTSAFQGMPVSHLFFQCSASCQQLSASLHPIACCIGFDTFPEWRWRYTKVSHKVTCGAGTKWHSISGAEMPVGPGRPRAGALEPQESGWKSCAQLGNQKLWSNRRKTKSKGTVCPHTM